MTPEFSFQREERLKSEKAIAALFRQGQSLMSYPVRVVWMFNRFGDPGKAKAGFSVSKRLFKKAVQRNRIKRQIREAYRLHKHELYARLPADQHVSLLLIYVAKEPLPYAEIEKGVKKMVFKLDAALKGG